MILNSLKEVNTLGDWAALGIRKHLEKILSHEPEVLQDKDPEELHQMRVGNAATAFGFKWVCARFEFT
jgi:CHAD domain-containing protein